MYANHRNHHPLALRGEFSRQTQADTEDVCARTRAGDDAKRRIDECKSILSGQLTSVSGGPSAVDEHAMQVGISFLQSQRSNLFVRRNCDVSIPARLRRQLSYMSTLTLFSLCLMHALVHPRRSLRSLLFGRFVPEAPAKPKTNPSHDKISCSNTQNRCTQPAGLSQARLAGALVCDASSQDTTYRGQKCG